MAPPSGDGYIETVFTCEGDYNDPKLYARLQTFRNNLAVILSKEKEKLILKKVEPWNSVKVTFNIPKEAAKKLKLLAEQGDQNLRQLGILSLQIEGDRLISLTIAGKNNERTELVFQTTESKKHASKLTSKFDSSSSDELLAAGQKSAEVTQKNIADYLSKSNVGIFNTLFGGGQVDGDKVGFKSPNTVVTQINPIPFPSSMDGGNRLHDTGKKRRQSKSSELGTEVGPTLSEALSPFSSAGTTFHAINSPGGLHDNRDVFSFANASFLQSGNAGASSASPLLVNLLQNRLCAQENEKYLNNTMLDVPLDKSMPPPPGGAFAMPWEVPPAKKKRKRKPKTPPSAALGAPTPSFSSIVGNTDDPFFQNMMPHPAMHGTSLPEPLPNMSKPFESSLNVDTRLSSLDSIISAVAHGHVLPSPPSYKEPSPEKMVNPYTGQMEPVQKSPIKSNEMVMSPSSKQLHSTMAVSSGIFSPTPRTGSNVGVENNSVPPLSDHDVYNVINESRVSISQDLNSDLLHKDLIIKRQSLMDGIHMSHSNDSDISAHSYDVTRNNDLGSGGETTTTDTTGSDGSSPPSSTDSLTEPVTNQIRIEPVQTASKPPEPQSNVITVGIALEQPVHNQYASSNAPLTHSLAEKLLNGPGLHWQKDNSNLLPDTDSNKNLLGAKQLLDELDNTVTNVKVSEVVLAGKLLGGVLTTMSPTIEDALSVPEAKPILCVKDSAGDAGIEENGPTINGVMDDSTDTCVKPTLSPDNNQIISNEDGNSADSVSDVGSTSPAKGFDTTSSDTSTTVTAEKEKDFSPTLSQSNLLEMDGKVNVNAGIDRESEMIENEEISPEQKYEKRFVPSDLPNNTEMKNNSNNVDMGSACFDSILSVISCGNTVQQVDISDPDEIPGAVIKEESSTERVVDVTETGEHDVVEKTDQMENGSSFEGLQLECTTTTRSCEEPLQQETETMPDRETSSVSDTQTQQDNSSEIVEETTIMEALDSDSVVDKLDSKTSATIVVDTSNVMDDSEISESVIENADATEDNGESLTKKSENDPSSDNETHENEANDCNKPVENTGEEIDNELPMDLSVQSRTNPTSEQQRSPEHQCVREEEMVRSPVPESLDPAPGENTTQSALETEVPGETISTDDDIHEKVVTNVEKELEDDVVEKQWRDFTVEPLVDYPMSEAENSDALDSSESSTRDPVSQSSTEECQEPDVNEDVLVETKAAGSDSEERDTDMPITSDCTSSMDSKSGDKQSDEPVSDGLNQNQNLVNGPPPSEVKVTNCDIPSKDQKKAVEPITVNITSPITMVTTSVVTVAPVSTAVSTTMSNARGKSSFSIASLLNSSTVGKAANTGSLDADITSNSPSGESAFTKTFAPMPVKSVGSSYSGSELKFIKTLQHPPVTSISNTGFMSSSASVHSSSSYLPAATFTSSQGTSYLAFNLTQSIRQVINPLPASEISPPGGIVKPVATRSVPSPHTQIREIGMSPPLKDSKLSHTSTAFTPVLTNSAKSLSSGSRICIGSPYGSGLAKIVPTRIIQDHTNIDMMNTSKIVIGNRISPKSPRSPNKSDVTGNWPNASMSSAYKLPPQQSPHKTIVIGPSQLSMAAKSGKTVSLLTSPTHHRVSQQTHQQHKPISHSLNIKPDNKVTLTTSDIHKLETVVKNIKHNVSSNSGNSGNQPIDHQYFSRKTQKMPVKVVYKLNDGAIVVGDNMPNYTINRSHVTGSVKDAHFTEGRSRKSHGSDCVPLVSNIKNIPSPISVETKSVVPWPKNTPNATEKSNTDLHVSPMKSLKPAVRENDDKKIGELQIETVVENKNISNDSSGPPEMLPISPSQLQIKTRSQSTDTNESSAIKCPSNAVNDSAECTIAKTEEGCVKTGKVASRMGRTSTDSNVSHSSVLSDVDMPRTRSSRSRTAAKDAERSNSPAIKTPKSSTKECTQTTTPSVRSTRGSAKRGKLTTTEVTATPETQPASSRTTNTSSKTSKRKLLDESSTVDAKKTKENSDGTEAGVETEAVAIETTSNGPTLEETGTENQKPPMGRSRRGTKSTFDPSSDRSEAMPIKKSRARRNVKSPIEESTKEDLLTKSKSRGRNTPPATLPTEEAVNATEAVNDPPLKRRATRSTKAQKVTTEISHPKRRR